MRKTRRLWIIGLRVEGTRPQSAIRFTCQTSMGANPPVSEAPTLKRIFVCALVLLGLRLSYAQSSQSLSVPAESQRWDLEGEAKVADYLGRKCILLNGGAAVLKQFE